MVEFFPLFRTSHSRRSLLIIPGAILLTGGGNRSFAEYDTFRYTLSDFEEKARVLQPGSFLVEFLPEENAVNYEYLYEIKKLAEQAGFVYYSKVPWIKGTFKANTGRKSKNTEDMMIFSLGRARSLRPNNKTGGRMSGTSAMLPPAFNVQKPGKKDIVHQAEKPVELIEQLIPYITEPGETILDQFAGSMNVGLAAARTGRNALLIEKDAATFTEHKDRISLRVNDMGENVTLSVI